VNGRLGVMLVVASVAIVAGFRCPGNPVPPAPPARDTLRVPATLPLTPINGRLTVDPSGQSGVQVSADSAGQVGATLGPALAPVAVTTAMRFRLSKSGAVWRWRLVVIATGRVVATSGESYSTRAADSTAARRVAELPSTTPIGP
jgi:hypothetical protein